VEFSLKIKEGVPSSKNFCALRRPIEKKYREGTMKRALRKSVKNCFCVGDYEIFCFIAAVRYSVPFA